MWILVEAKLCLPFLSLDQAGALVLASLGEEGGCLRWYARSPILGKAHVVAGREEVRPLYVAAAAVG